MATASSIIRVETSICDSLTNTIEFILATVNKNSICSKQRLQAAFRLFDRVFLFSSFIHSFIRMTAEAFLLTKLKTSLELANSSPIKSGTILSDRLMKTGMEK